VPQFPTIYIYVRVKHPSYQIIPVACINQNPAFGGDQRGFSEESN